MNVESTMATHFDSSQLDHRQELKRLNLKTRNRVRAILAPGTSDSFALLNQLRAEKSPGEILQIDRVLRSGSKENDLLIPELFPSAPQTSEDFHRLETLAVSTQLQMLESLVRQHYSTLQEFFEATRTLDRSVLSHDWALGSALIGKLRKSYGYSHLLLRKAALIRDISGGENIAEIDTFLKQGGMDRRNIFVTSLINCYTEENDFLSHKKSIMNLPKRGRANQFTRDICRIPFHPFAKDDADLAQLLQSGLQSSLIDAVMVVKVNAGLTEGFFRETSMISSLFGELDNSAQSIDQIAGLYPLDDVESESNFYKHSSAWLENSEIMKYRLLQDHFYDFPEADYSQITVGLVDQIRNQIAPVKLGQLANAENLTQHAFANLKALEQSGTMTRSAIFNYLLHVEQGNAAIAEVELFDLMGKTRDLAKTSNANHLRNLAKFVETKLSKLVLHLLIARKSKNEFDDHRLRRVLQEIATHDHGGSIVGLLDTLNARSSDVARYAYEVCTEDFIAKLFHIIKTSSEITETRASLHKWMGQLTGEKAFFDRARTLLIDHQINKIRNEIDDNRIYVDTARFAEWINDEVLRELNGVLTSIEHRNGIDEDADPQLVQTIERCYFDFCSNKIFGIASYMGRRIRHGTFKGHLYSSVISIERSDKYERLLRQPAVAGRWAQWKSEYEAKIDDIIINRLHVESSSKPDGFLKPSLTSQAKQDTLVACAKTLTRDFVDSKSSANAPSLITEYCWRLAEFDLKAINVFLKNRRAGFSNYDSMSEIKVLATNSAKEAATDFCRDLNRLIEEKFMTMYNWFKRPSNVSPKVSLSQLYKAVVAEVKGFFHDFDTATDFEPSDDIELIGGMYHNLYDSFYVIVYNAAKHGKAGEGIQKNFTIVERSEKPKKLLKIEITSTIKDEDTDDSVNQILAIKPGDDITDAQVSEARSGLRKLHQLQHFNKDFAIESIGCSNRKVTVVLTYALEH